LDTSQLNLGILLDVYFHCRGPGKYRHIGLPLAPGTSLGAAQGGGHPGSAVTFGPRAAARGTVEILVACEGRASGASCRVRPPSGSPSGTRPHLRIHPTP